MGHIHIASWQMFHRDTGQTGGKTGCPSKNGTGGNPTVNSSKPKQQWNDRVLHKWVFRPEPYL